MTQRHAISAPACAALASLLLAACAGPPPIPEGLPPDFSDEHALTEADRALDLPGAVDAARDALARRGEPGSLERAVALLHHQRLAGCASTEADVLLAEAHARIADGLDATSPEKAPRCRRHTEAGLARAEATTRSDPENGPAHYWRGRLLLLAADVERSYGRLSQALKALAEADRLAPLTDEAGPARYLARIYQETPGWPMLGSKEKAIAHYERAVELAPACLLTRLWLGETYAAAGRKEKARAEWKRVLAAPVRAGREREDEAIRIEARKRLEPR
jgi:tetratricopeptide (TPR) repeat protein